MSLQDTSRGLSDAVSHSYTSRIYVLGLGSVGLLVAHSLMRLEPPSSVTLLLHRTELLDEFRRMKETICLIDKQTNTVSERNGYDVAVLTNDVHDNVPCWMQVSSTSEEQSIDSLSEVPALDTGDILCLVVACKCPYTVSALRLVRHRITTKTTICLLQNGMGQVDELNDKVFVDPDTRPTFILGIISHGLYLEDKFTAVHAGRGTIALGILRDLKSHLQTTAVQVSPTAAYLLRTLEQAPDLNCRTVDYKELVQMQLEKLLVNCILNPLTALLDVENGQLLDDEDENDASLSSLYRRLVIETANIIRKILPSLPETRGPEEDEARTARFSPERLTRHFEEVTTRNAANSSSMREDFRRRNETEIDYINGYVVRRARELGHECVMNEFLVILVKAKCKASRRIAAAAAAATE